MPLYTLINPSEAPFTTMYGTFSAWSLNRAIELNNAQARNAVQQHGAVLLDDGADERTLARAAFSILAELTPGIDTASQREQFRSKAGLQEWQNILKVLDAAD